MSGESGYARELVKQGFIEAKERPDMDADALGRAIIQAVVEQYRGYREMSDIARELEYLAETLDEDEPVVTRGC